MDKGREEGAGIEYLKVDVAKRNPLPWNEESWKRFSYIGRFVPSIFKRPLPTFAESDLLPWVASVNKRVKKHSSRITRRGPVK